MTDLGRVGVAVGAADHSRLRRGAGLALHQIRWSDPVLVGHTPLLLPRDGKRGDKFTEALVPAGRTCKSPGKKSSQSTTGLVKQPGTSWRPSRVFPFVPTC